MKKRKNSSNLKKKKNSFVYWAPRVLSILFVIFLGLFSLDIFDMKLNLLGIIVGLFMHNIPAIILLVVIIISWRHEIVGGVAFILAGLLYIIFLINNKFEWYMVSWVLIISGPAIITGILWLIAWRERKRQH